MLKKILSLIMITLLMSIAFTSSVARANESVNIEPESIHTVSYDVTSNYYGQEEDTTKISNPDETVLKGYKRAAVDNGVELYVNEAKLNIAVKLPNGYIFYSEPNYYGYDIQAYLTTGGLSEISSTILVNGKYSTDKNKNVSPKITYDYETVNGFVATIDFDKIGIKIPVYVYLENSKLMVNVKEEEIEEIGYTETKTEIVKDANGKPIEDEETGMYKMQTVTTTYNYALTSFTLFQYFGCVGYDAKGFDNQINGYNFIPDGSGALSRYQYSRTYTTRLSKRVYGVDVGIKEYTSLTSHLSDTINVTIPVYGVAHGYEQNAFLCVIEDGSGAAELYLEPFGYASRNIQTSYFRFYTREQYRVKISTSESGSTVTLPKEMYGDNILYSYNFLYDGDATYSGMAKLYRDEYLNLNDIDEGDSIPLGLNVLAQDYKPGLFGKNFVVMTKYKDLLNIIKILENEGVEDFSVSYLGAQRRGFYNNNNWKPQISYRLGSRKSFNELISYMNDNGYNIELCLDILTSYKESKKGVVKKYNLSIFEKYSDSDLFDTAYLLNVVDSSGTVLKYNKNYSKLGISSLNLEYYSLNNFSYRYKSKNYSRTYSINAAKEELSKMAEKYELSLVGANAYAFDSLSRLYDTYSSATLYTFFSDSVPFLELVLSGHTEMYSEEINFVSDYNRYCLRLIEYNIYPYFTVTNEESSKLRYTSSESLYTSQFSLWEEDIVKFYTYVNGALSNVVGSNMTSHRYVSTGVSETTYSNGVKIYVNYNDHDVTYNGTVIKTLSYEVVR